MIKMFGLIGAGYSALISVVIEVPVVVIYLKKIFKSEDSFKR
jgi:Na+-driven multidrug efflux pump